MRTFAALVRPARVTLGQFSIAFIPFGLLLTLALLWPESVGNLDVNRTKALIWPATALLAIALITYFYADRSASATNVSALFWSFACAAFLAHAFWATFLVFDGVADTFRKMGP